MVIFVIIFLLVLGLLVFVHELGHFAVAKLSGIQVEEFAFGFPPRLFSIVKKGTRYSVNALPLGGYVRLLGEENASNSSRSYGRKPPLARLVVVIAGVVMNVAVAWILLTIWFAITITRPPANAVIIAQVLPHTAADKAGLLQGDILVAADLTHFDRANDLARFTREHQRQNITFTVRRFGRDVRKQIILGSEPTPLGVAPVDLGTLPADLSPWRAPIYAGQELAMIVASNAQFIGRVIGSIAGGPKVHGEISGPIGIFGILSQMVSLGPLYLVRFVANLSLLVGFFNILPIPALDGGKALFVALEMVARRRVVREHIEQAIHFAGFVLLVGLLVIVSYHDIIKLITRRL